jgi:hypothetical protein
MTERWRLTQSLQVHILRPYSRGQVPRCYSLSDPWTENTGKNNNSAVEITILPVEIASLQCKTEPLGYTGHRVLGSDAAFGSSPQSHEVPGFPYSDGIDNGRPLYREGYVGREEETPEVYRRSGTEWGSRMG